ncbi:MAG: alkaline phosphatase family protein [Acidobacteria bacterium]|nr:alkaline phosphatase family protein [Acidobacteriota bacterium]
MRRSAAAALRVILAATFLPLWQLGAAPQTTPSNPKLIVVIAVDQMLPDYLSRYQSYYTGGLKWLYDNGVVFENAVQNHAVTETAPGYSAMLSGLNPGRNGIVANQWYDRARQSSVYCVEDLTTAILQDAKAEGRSPRNFKATTLGDWLKDASPASRVVALSGKDRSAILLGGQRADEVYWYNSANGRLVTSNYYQRQISPWADSFNGRRIAASYFGKTWAYLKSSGLYRLFGEDNEAAEDDWDSTFPHQIGRGLFVPNAAFYASFTGTPFLDELLLAAAREATAANKLGQRRETDLLCLALSATDYIGHRYGPGSHEIADQLLRLDVSLGDFFEFLDERVGLKNIAIVLTSDHGVLPLPETLAAQGVKASRLEKSDLVFFQGLNSYLDGKFGSRENWLVFFSDFNLYLNYPALLRHKLPRPDAEAAVKEYLRQSTKVAAVYSRSDMELALKRQDEGLELFRNNFNPDLSGDVFVQFSEFLLATVERRGTTHGSPYPYDRHVPLVFYGPAWKHKSISEEARVIDIAPTLAEMLGLSTPKKLDGVSRLKWLQ